MATHRSLFFLVALAALLASACSGSEAPAPSADRSEVEEAGQTAATATAETAATQTTDDGVVIRRTSHNVPHVRAADYRGLGFGYGYVMAEDHFCTLADMVVQVRGEAAATFGAGPNDHWLNQDLVYRSLDITGLAEADLNEYEPELLDLADGFAAGITRYLDETGFDNVPGYCAGENWIDEVTVVDVAAMSRRLSWQASVTPLIDFIATAQPPAVDEGPASGDEPAPDLEDPLPEPTETGSNAWAVGPDRTLDGTTMLVGNPHFPWQGSLRFYEAHLTIPGEIDVYGMSLIGAPVINIGFNENVAWSHTVSAGRRFTTYSLTLVDGDPTSYLYDGEPRAMTSTTVSVDVLQDDGSVAPVERTLYSSHHGPVVSLPGLGWNERLTFSMRDANRDNNEIASQFLAMSRAESMDGFIDAHRMWQGIPWVNTIAASADGRIWYADTSATPHLSDAAIEAWYDRLANDPLTGIAFQNGTFLLDGSDPLYEWVDDPEARDPGVEPFDAAPQIERSDYLFNANDPYWVPHREELLSGASPLHGLAETPVSNRTRMNVVQLAPGTGGAGDDDLFTLAELQSTALANRVFTAEMLLDDFLVRCRAESPEQELCDVLEQWDQRVDLDSVGAALWREFIGTFNNAELTEAGPLWATGFDPADPIGTPSGLSDDGELIERLVAAAEVLRSAGFDIDTPLGQMQIAQRGETAVSVHGGYQSEGVTNIITPGGNGTTTEPDIATGAPIDGSPTLTDEGYPVSGGTSFLYSVEFTEDGPVAAGFLTYGQTGDPASPYFADQTERFAAKDWRPMLFDDDAIDADDELVEYTLDP